MKSKNYFIYQAFEGAGDMQMSVNSKTIEFVVYVHVYLPLIVNKCCTELFVVKMVLFSTYI